MKNLKTVAFLLTLFFVWSCDNNVQPKSINIPTIKEEPVDTNLIITDSTLRELVVQIEKEDFETAESVSEIPTFIQGYLDSLSGYFDIANKDEKWNVGCNQSRKLASRQLAYFGMGNDIALYTYYTGGMARSSRILIIEFENKTVTSFWSYSVLADIRTKDEIVNAIRRNNRNKFRFFKNGNLY